MGASPDEQQRTEILHSLRHPRGRYPAERAAQLSGIPKSTIYDWQRNAVYVPDYSGKSPMAWSYRDLVFLRVLAWLRNDVKTPRPDAAHRVRLLKQHISSGFDVTTLNADKESFVADGDVVSPLDGPSRLFADMLLPFDLTSTVADFGRSQRLWGPDLVTPSRHTFISPWVLGGDPCVDRTRIPTASIYALQRDRGLDIADIVNLYPGLGHDAARDAFELEERLHGTHNLQAA